MSETTETDAAWNKYISHPYTYGAGDLRILAQRLEQERDQAREQNAKLQKQIEGLNNFANERFEEIQKVRRERDEAREKCAKLREIAERAINYLDQSYRDGFCDEASDLRAELDQIKETSK
jgi:uncharacterized coiled-coil DUF342 family protein